MADPETTSPSTRRAARLARSRRWRRVGGIALSILMIGVLATTALVIAGVVELPGAGTRVDAAGRTTHTPTPTTPPRSKHAERALSTTAPLRLWIAGDSLAGSVGPSLGEITAQTGVVAPQYDSRVSSGLLNPDFFDWPDHAREQLAQLDPEAVVFVIGTNDANVWTPSLATDYRARTEAMMRELVGTEHRKVYWVAPPVMRDPDLEEGVRAVDQIARQAAAAVKGVTYVDAHTLFADEHGDYQQSFADELGQRHVMRAGDGIHFSADGGDYLGRKIFELLDTTWHITAQADPSHPQPVKETKGSTQVPGTHRSVGSTSSGRTGTSATTRPRTYATATTTTSGPPPTTAATEAPTTTTTAATSTTTAAATGVPSGG
jgi:hypothetical protein